MGIVLDIWEGAFFSFSPFLAHSFVLSPVTWPQTRLSQLHRDQITGPLTWRQPESKQYTDWREGGWGRLGGCRRNSFPRKTGRHSGSPLAPRNGTKSQKQVWVEIWGNHPVQLAEIWGHPVPRPETEASEDRRREAWLLPTPLVWGFNK